MATGNPVCGGAGDRPLLRPPNLHNEPAYCLPGKGRHHTPMGVAPRGSPPSTALSVDAAGLSLVVLRGAGGQRLLCSSGALWWLWFWRGATCLSHQQKEGRGAGQQAQGTPQEVPPGAHLKHTHLLPPEREVRAGPPPGDGVTSDDGPPLGFPHSTGVCVPPSRDARPLLNLDPVVWEDAAGSGGCRSMHTVARLRTSPG